MPHSLRAKLKCLRYKKLISDKDCDRLCKALDFEHKAEIVISQLRADRDRLADAIVKIRAELHATAEMYEDGDYYLRDEWIDEIFDKYKAGMESEE